MLWLALTMYVGQVVASTVVVALTPHASGGGLTEFQLYFAVGDWLSIRIPLAVTASATVAFVLLRQGISRPPTNSGHHIFRAVAAFLRGLSVAAGIACGSLTVGLVLWLVTLRVESTAHYFPQYSDWPLASVAYVLLLGASIGLGSVVLAFRRDDEWRAGYFVLCFGLLTLFCVLGVASYDVVGATYGWSGLAALIAAALTLAGSAERVHVLLATTLAMLVAAVIFALTFSFRSSAAVVIGLIVLQVLTLRSLIEADPLTPDVNP